MKVRLLRVASGLYVEAHTDSYYRSVRVDCEPKHANVALRMLANADRVKAHAMLEKADQLDAMAFELERQKEKRIA